MIYFIRILFVLFPRRYLRTSTLFQGGGGVGFVKNIDIYFSKILFFFMFVANNCLSMIVDKKNFILASIT